MLYSTMDKTDSYILRTLQENARTPLCNIAQDLGVSSAQVLNRVKALEKSTIQGYTTQLRAKNCSSLILANTPIDTKKSFDKLQKHQNVSSVAVLAGNFDVSFHLSAQSAKELYDILQSFQSEGMITSFIHYPHLHK